MPRGRVASAARKHTAARAMAGHLPGRPVVRQLTKARIPRPIRPGTARRGAMFTSMEPVK